MRHSTQDIVIENEDGSVEITIKIYPGYKFYHDIRGWGKNVKVLSPDEVLETISKDL